MTYKIGHFDIHLSFDFEKHLVFVKCSMTVKPLKDKTKKLSFIFPEAVQEVIHAVLNDVEVIPEMKTMSFIKIVNVLSDKPLLKENTSKVDLSYVIDATKYSGTIDKEYIELGMEIGYWLPFVLDQTFTYTLKASVPKEFYAQVNAKGDFALDGNNKVYTFSSATPSPKFPRFYASTIKPVIKKKSGFHIELHIPDAYREWSDFIANSFFEILTLYQKAFGVVYDYPIAVFVRKSREGQDNDSSFGGKYIVALSESRIREYVLKGNKKDTEDYLFYLLSHELGHTLFPDTVAASVILPGNAFLIEGFAEFCFLYAAENHYKNNEKIVQQLDEEYEWYARKLKSLGNAAMPLNLASTLDEEPKRISYSKGALGLRMLRYVMGDENFFPAMRAYIVQHTGEIASVSDFENILQQHSQDSLQWFFEDYFSSLKDLDFSLKDINVDEKKSLITFTVENIGDARFEAFLEIMVRTNKGKKIYKVNLSGNKNFQFSVYGKVKSIEVDPSWFVLDLDRYNNVFPQRGWLGIEVGTIDNGVKNKTGYMGSGIYIKDVIPNSEAEKVQLKPFDVLIKVDDATLKDVHSLEKILSAKKVGERIVLTLYRGGKVINIKALLDKKAEGDKQLLATY